MTNFADDYLDEIMRVYLNMMDNYFILFEARMDNYFKMINLPTYDRLDEINLHKLFL
jgi:hypothetical protein